ncbi:uroporphyrinogen-III synthase [Thalassobaculum salexigens]|uniref:uroporphyrinogen-III synthase n=1 Tax=Thalassobaculum salexigens TaxID=455360 RepID=UPI00040134C5|nr:uroporphyrinogen-III synthase [Thalassobaculum salexigens]
MAARRVIVTRPAEAAADLQAELAARGIEALAAPMLTVETIEPEDALPTALQAVLVTSGNGAQGAARLGLRRDLPVLAVGDATARAAAEAGFTAVTNAAGDAASLVDLVARACRPEAGPLVWVSGEAVSTDLVAALEARGYTVIRRIAYRTAMAATLPSEVVAGLRAGAVEGVLFFSPRSAEAFARLAHGLELEAACATVSAYCLSDPIARMASKLAWRTIHVAETPTKAALIAAVVEGGSDRKVEKD